MSCDMFSSAKALEVLKGKTVYLFGDSNTRAIYKDLIWLLEDGRLIPAARLKCKNELSHANDVRLSNGRLHGGRNYEEIRSYSENPYIMFHFITRLYLPDFIKTIKNLKYKPDVLIINSCVWDLTRWGSNGVEQFKQNLKDTFGFLKSYLPLTRIIWLTTLPPSFKSRGGFLTKEIEFLRNMLPWHIMFANKYASNLAVSLNIDVLDLHYNFRFLLNYHTKDGIHWDSKAIRHATNLLLTHIALCCNCKPPGEFRLDKSFLARSQILCNSTEIKPNENIEQKHESNVCCNTKPNKPKKKENIKRKQKFQANFQIPQAFNNPERLLTQQNQGELFQSPANVELNRNDLNFFNNICNAKPICSKNNSSNGLKQSESNAWHDDYPVTNFESRFSGIEQNQQSFWQHPFNPNNITSIFMNALNQPSFVAKFNSQVGYFRRQRNVQNQGRIHKRNRKRNC